MRDLGAPPGHQPAAPPTTPDREPSSEIPLWMVLAAVGLLVVVAAVGGFAFLRGQLKQGPTYPDQWDSRIAPYAKIAEQERGLLFAHPVEVRFLRPAAFEKTVTTDDSKLGKNDRKKIAQFTGLMRAFGLVKGDVDLFKASNQASGAGTLAYYSFDDKTITIRGSRLTPNVRVTLVHELTHALQDQHFDVGERMKQLRKSDDSSTSSEESVLDAMVEGDAERVENLYRKSLSPAQRRAADAGAKGELKKENKRVKNVPKVILTMMMSPYTLGETAVDAVAADGGNAVVDQMFRNPPTHETALLDPVQALSGHTDATKVTDPQLRAGEKKFDSGELGVLTWYFMLAERMPLRDALAAADGWGGDQYVAFDRNGESCARMTYTGRTSRDTTRMLVALRRWIAAAPGSPAQVRRVGHELSFQSCDPGKSSRVGRDASERALELVGIRANVGVGFLRQGAPERSARCAATKLVRAFSFAQLTEPKLYEKHPAALQKARRIVANCR